MRPGQPGEIVQNEDADNSDDKADPRSGEMRPHGLNRLFDRFLQLGSGDETQFEKPLRTVFLAFLALLVLALTIQNVVSEYRNLREPQDLIVQTAGRLLMQQKARGVQMLDRVAVRLSTDSTLQEALRRNDSAGIRKIAEDVFSRSSAELDIAEFTIYAPDHKLVYRADRGITHPPEPLSFRSELSDTLFKQTTGIEFAPGGALVVSVLRPWVTDGKLIGYLKLAIDIEGELALASSAVNAEIVKFCPGCTDDRDHTGQPGFEPVGNFSVSRIDLAAFRKAAGDTGKPGRFLMEDNRIYMVRDLPIARSVTVPEAGLILVKDITENVLTFLKDMVLFILAGTGISVLAWAVLHRLLTRIQSSVAVARSRLESEVRENTKKLQHSSRQLLEAQRIASIGSWEWDLETNEVKGSEEFYRIMRVPADMPASQMREYLFSIIPDNEEAMVRQTFKRAIKTCSDFDFEHSVVFKDGSARYLRVRGDVTAGSDCSAAHFFGIVHDTTESRLAERRNRLLANILESSLNEILILDAETFRVEYANKCALDNMGYSFEEIRNRPVWEINPVYDQETVRRSVVPLLNGRKNSLSFENLHRRKDGSDYPVDLQVQLFTDVDRQLFVAIANDVSERVQRENETREAKNRAERLAYFDPLTKLSNRAACRRDAAKLFSLPHKPAFLVHVDMDGFKQVNDSLGHQAGDLCLEETGRRLREVSRGLGTPYRWGGDEFVILADNSSADPDILFERARRIMRMPMEYEGNRYWPTVSMGIALCPADGDDFETLLGNADLALYQSKENGKDRFTHFRQDMKKDSEKEAQMEQELQKAVGEDEFFLVFQPQVNLRSQYVTGVEALLRWQHPLHGELAPGEFLSVLEKSSLAPVVGEMVIDKALAAARGWLDAGLDFGRISVNVSPGHLGSGQIVDHFRSALERHGISAGMVTAEVLESVFLNDNRTGHLATLQALHDLGIQIELDDFGTGYASLTHVADLPISGLKIDRSFTHQMLSDHRKETVVNQLIHLARSLNVGVVCEGVETEAQYARLRMMGDFSIQGYLIARPMPLEQMTDWISESLDDLVFLV